MNRFSALFVGFLLTSGCSSRPAGTPSPEAGIRPPLPAQVIFERWYSTDPYGNIHFGYVKNVGDSTAYGVMVETNTSADVFAPAKNRWISAYPESLLPGQYGQIQALRPRGGTFPPILQIVWAPTAHSGEILKSNLKHLD